MSDRLARVALGAVCEPGDARLARLVAAHGAEEILARLREGLAPGAAAGGAAARLADLDPARSLRQAERLGIRFLTPQDAEWPWPVEDLATVEPLNGHAGAPLGLWARGEADLGGLARRAVSVVGSRSATTYGAAVARDLAADLAGAGVTVVSGAAFGIDQAAHRGALAADGPTVAVLACGVDRAYPAAHRDLLAHIVRRGVVVSELAVGCAPTRVRFLARNRLIAALGRGTVVVEAAVRSGALNTANWALRLHRVVMGVPGPVTSAPSEGVHELIRVRGAELVTRAADVQELVGASGEALAEPRRGPVHPRDGLDPLTRRVLEAVPRRRAAGAAAVSRTAGVALETTVRSLEELSGRGLVEPHADGWRVCAEEVR